MDNKQEIIKAEKPAYRPLLKTDKIFLFIIFALCFIVIDFAAFGGMALGFTISYILLFAVSLVYIIKKEQKPTAFSIICGVLSVIGSLTFTLFTGNIKIPMFFLVMGLYIAFTTGSSRAFLSNEGSYKIAFDWLKNIFVLPFCHMPVIVGSAKAGTKTDKRFVGTLIGIALAIPVVCVIVPLLLKSDAAYYGLMQSLFEKISDQLAFYIIEAILAAVIFPYAYSYLFALRNKSVEGSNKKIKMKRFLPSNIAVSFLSVVSLCYAVYLFSQLAYFVSAFSYILPEDYDKTASSFAREGFYQMCVVSIINVLLISFVFAFVKRKNKRIPAAIKGLALFMSAFSLFLIVSAIQKMRLNISVYGLSFNRIMVFVLMLMLIVAFVCLVIHIFVPKFGYVQPIVVICSCLFIALAFTNVDRQIAKYNIEQYSQGKIEYLDRDNIMSLGSSSAEYVIELHKDGKILESEFNEYVSDCFYDRIEIEIEDIEKPAEFVKQYELEKFTFYNSTRERAVKQITEYMQSRNN